MEALTLLGQVPSDAGRVVRRLHELDLRFADAEERDPHPIGRDVHDRLERQPDEVAVHRQRLVEGLDHDREVVDPAGGPVPQVRHAWVLL